MHYDNTHVSHLLFTIITGRPEGESCGVEQAVRGGQRTDDRPAQQEPQVRKRLFEPWFSLDSLKTCDALNRV